MGRRLIFQHCLIITISACLLSGCSKESISQEKKLPLLQQVKDSGRLRVLTRYGITTYYEGREGYSGLEYDLIQLFANRLKVKTEFIVPDSFSDLLTLIAAGEAEIAAAGLTITPERTKNMRFTPAYWHITEQLIYRSGTRRPRSLADINTGLLEVVEGTSHVETLKQLKIKHPGLEWNETSELNTDGLMYLVNKGLIDYTVADSNQVLLIRRFYPKLYVAFDLSPPRSLAWAMARSTDSSLYDEAVRFFQDIRKNKLLAQLVDKHYGHTGALNYVGICTFRKHVRTRLPRYRNHFIQAGEKFGIDWRLLAAIGYQESHWNNEAVSPSGVRGIMMLTENTARQLQISDRLDPKQSIPAGTRYFLQRKRKIPSRIPEPDRTWMALAAYNIGYGHLEDARVLTQKQGYSPDKWVDVKNALPLLSEKKWYQKTRHGYARGVEPVRYVENIRNYYDLLVWLTEGDAIKENAMRPAPEQAPVSEAAQRILELDTPVL